MDALTDSLSSSYVELLGILVHFLCIEEQAVVTLEMLIWGFPNGYRTKKTVCN